MIFDRLLQILNHVTVVHFPIIGIVMGFVAGGTALAIAVAEDMLSLRNSIDEEMSSRMKRFSEYFEFVSFALILMGMGGIILAAVTGVRAAGDLETSVNDELLQFKITLSIFLFFVLLTPVVQKIFMGLKYKRHVFTSGSRVIPLLYLFPLVIGAVLTILIQSAGEQYKFGFNVLDLLGLGWLLPE